MWCWVEVFSVVGGRARVPLTASAQSAPFENRRAKEKNETTKKLDKTENFKDSRKNLTQEIKVFGRTVSNHQKRSTVFYKNQVDETFLVPFLKLPPGREKFDKRLNQIFRSSRPNSG